MHGYTPMQYIVKGVITGEAFHFTVKGNTNNLEILIDHRAPGISADDVVGRNEIVAGAHIECRRRVLPPVWKSPGVFLVKRVESVVKTVECRIKRSKRAVVFIIPHNTVCNAKRECCVGRE